ncbi:MAG: class I SAM-dependent methyltransferase [Chloroflexi bacterium]|nr:class I SAM-dependent methyltransferase [Chloroflexota bacterium]
MASQRLRGGATATDHADALGAGYWDTVSESMDAGGHYLDRFLGDLKTQAYLGLFARWLPVPPVPALKTDLFEESNGVDSLLWRIASPPANTYGMDLSPQMARRAMEQEPEPYGGFVSADARRLPFASASLGFVFSPSTLDHFEDRADLAVSLREILRVLRPGGVLLITLANRSNIGDPLRRLAIRMRIAPYYIGASYSPAQLRRELESAGFLVREQSALVHHPRMMGVACARLASLIRWRWLTRAFQRALLAMQRCADTRWRYATGCFVAALAAKPLPGEISEP